MAKKDFDAIKPHVREDFVWETVGKDDAISYDDLAGELKKRPTVTELKIENALSHGNGAMCEGALLLEGGELFQLCNVVLFVNTAKDALVKKAHTYLVS